MKLEIEIDEAKIQAFAIANAEERIRQLLYTELKSYGLQAAIFAEVKAELAKQIPPIVAEHLANNEKIEQTIFRSLRARVDRLVREIGTQNEH